MLPKNQIGCIYDVFYIESACHLSGDSWRGVLVNRMKQLQLKTGVFLIIITFLGLSISQPLIQANELSMHPEKQQLVSKQAPAAMQSTGQAVAAGGLAGAGAAKNIDPVVLRNVIIGLVFAGLLAASALNEAE